MLVYTVCAPKLSTSVRAKFLCSWVTSATHHTCVSPSVYACVNLPSTANNSSIRVLASVCVSSPYIGPNPSDTLRRKFARVE